MENGHQPVSSFGVFAALLGMIIGGFLLAYMISCLQTWLEKRPQQAPQQKPITDKAPTDESDLEAGLNTISDKPRTIQKHHRHSFSSIRRPGILRWSKISAEPPKRDNQDLKDKISRPTRLLPSHSTSVVVRSPLQPPPLASNRSRSLESQRVTHNLSRHREADLLSGNTVAEQSNRTVVNVNDSPPQKGQPKRTIVWFDQLSEEGSSLNPRSSRSNSLPSSWDEILHSPTFAREEEPQEARLRLGSVSELWLDFQSQLAVG